MYQTIYQVYQKQHISYLHLSLPISGVLKKRCKLAVIQINFDSHGHTTHPPRCELFMARRLWVRIPLVQFCIPLLCTTSTNKICFIHQFHLTQISDTQAELRRYDNALLTMIMYRTRPACKTHRKYNTSDKLNYQNGISNTSENRVPSPDCDAHNILRSLPSRHKMSNQCCFDVGPTS